MALTLPRYTVADLDLLPDDGNRYEVLAGTLLVTPSPGSAHQGVAAGLAALFASSPADSGCSARAWSPCPR